MVTFTGVNNTENLLAIGERALQRRKDREREDTLKQTGGYIADGDFSSASNALLRSGDIENGIKVDEIGRTRKRETSNAGIIAEALGSMANGGSGVAKEVPGSNRPVSSQLSMPRDAAITSEALPEMGADQSSATKPSVATAIGGVPAQKGGLATSQISEQTGGDLSSGMLFSMAAKFAKEGDVDMSEKYMDAATTRKEVERELGKKEEAKQAQYIFDIYSDADPEGKKTLIDQILADPNLTKTIPEEILSALSDRNPANDDAAVIAWTRMFGGDPSRLEGKIDTADERSNAIAEEKRQNADELSTYRSKKQIDLDFAEKETRKEAELAAELGGGSADQNDTSSPDYDPYTPEYRNVPTSVKNTIYKSEEGMMKDASKTTERADLINQKSLEFMQTLTDEGLWEKMGSGWWEGVQRVFVPSEIARLDGITNELVTEMKKPGAGVFTDDDARRAELSVVSKSKNQEGLRSMMVAASIAKERAEDHEDFLSDYQSKNGIGSLRKAERTWKEYTEENPILLYDDTQKTALLNEDRLSFEDWNAQKENKKARADFETRLDGLDPADEQAVLDGYGE